MNSASPASMVNIPPPPLVGSPQVHALTDAKTFHQIQLRELSLATGKGYGL
jgi:hypothetical protein